MSVKIIPITPEYREGWENVDWNNKKTPCASGESSVSDVLSASEIQGVRYSPPTPLIAPDCTGNASSAPRGVSNTNKGEDE
jgi:hypothetical protein